MRWPLRSQIMFPMACVMLATVVAISGLNAWFAGRQAIDRIESQLREISETLVATSFPLTDSVLKNMRGLSGAEFVVVNRSGQITATSRSEWADALPSARLPAHRGETLQFDRRLAIGEASYFWAALTLQRAFAVRQGAVLHVLYPVASYQQAWWEAVLPPLAAGSAGLAMMGILSFVIASRVTRPIHQLCEQVGRIARGQFVPVAIPVRDDEVRDLSLAISSMSEMLSRYEVQVRQNERLRTLGRLGGGFAHQIRNAATGCRLALDLHRRSCPAAVDESLKIAYQQLDLMEDFLGRFLSLGKFQSGPAIPVDLVEIVQRVLPLVQPKSRHLGVEVSWTAPESKPRVLGHPDGMVQVLVNLMLNAIEAAAAGPSPAAIDRPVARVSIQIEPMHHDGFLKIHVWDTGAGPAEHVRDTLFEALVSEKPDGVGLGLFLAREVVEHDGGKIAWTRQNELTCFTVELPAAGAE
jgi:signal transduction histidine kinase